MTRAESRHLADDRLIDLYFSDAASDDENRGDWQHVETCADCEERYERLAAMLGETTDQALFEADDVFTAERLEAQRGHILRRLETAGHPARVIPFPVAAPSRIHTGLSTRARRWVAAAAIAGALGGTLLGLNADRVVLLVRPHGVPQMASASHVMPKGAMKTIRWADSPDEEAFLARIDRALTEPRVEELQVLDELTPHARDMGARLPVRAR